MNGRELLTAILANCYNYLTYYFLHSSLARVLITGALLEPNQRRKSPRKKLANNWSLLFLK
jgi:argininosuccinate synthase